MRTLAVLPLVTPLGFGDRDRARGVFEPLIVQQLIAGDYQVIPPDSFWAVWKATSDSLDAMIGSRSDQNRAAPRASGLPMQLAETPLTGEHFGVVRTVALGRAHADAIVHSTLLVTYEATRGGTLRWYGAKADVSRNEGKFEPVHAWAIEILITAPDGSVLHRGTGGIEPAADVSFEASGTIGLGHAGASHTADYRRYFKDDRRNRHAVRYALTPFAASETPDR